MKSRCNTCLKFSLVVCKITKMIRVFHYLVWWRIWFYWVCLEAFLVFFTCFNLVTVKYFKLHVKNGTIMWNDNCKHSTTSYLLKVYDRIKPSVAWSRILQFSLKNYAQMCTYFIILLLRLVLAHFYSSDKMVSRPHEKFHVF